MAKKIKINKLITRTNTSLLSFEASRFLLFNYSKFDDFDNEQFSDAIDSVLEKISKTKSLITIDGSAYKLIEIGYSNFKRIKPEEEKKKVVFQIENLDGKFSISTGIYCGSIAIDDVSIIITTGLSKRFFERILNFCCGIYADVSDNTNSNDDTSIYSLLVQYMYLLSLRKVVHKTFPKKYIEMKDRGYEINGDIDIENYINQDLTSFDKKISYSYSARLEIQSIIDVLYCAFKACKIMNKNEVLPDSSNFGAYLKESYSGIRPTNKTVNNILKEKCLYNSLYADFKKPLEYARIILNNNDLNVGDKPVSTFGNFLVDSSFLWEMYLYNLMLIHLKDWEIDAQCNLSFYSDTFFAKNNYPDFVLTNKKTGRIFVLDAKFKKMTYSSVDVDNDDLRQLHGYSYYYSLKYGNKFCGAGLIYPSQKFRPDKSNNIDNMFGIQNVSAKFGIFSIKDPDDNEKLSDNELIFINELASFLNS